MNKYGSETAGIFLLSMEDYLKGFWPNLTEAKDLFDSLSSIDEVDLNIGKSMDLKNIWFVNVYILIRNVSVCT